MPLFAITMKRTNASLLLLSLVLLPSISWGQSDAFRRLNELFAGEFNNYGQVHQEREDSIPKEMMHEHIHSIFKPVTVPWLGSSVYFVKQFMDNDRSKVYRQRMYHFHENESEKAVQLDIYSFRDKETEKAFAESDVRPEILLGLTREKLTLSPGCEVYWKQIARDTFIGYMKERACNFISRNSGKRIFITDSLLLNRDEIRIRDEAEDEHGNYVFGHRGKIPHILRRCHYYTGWAAALPEGARDMVAIGDLRIHDQGDRQVVRYADGLPTGYEIRLAELIYGHRTSVLQLAVFLMGAEKPVVYNWSDPGSRRIGINMMRQFQAGLTHTP